MYPFLVILAQSMGEYAGGGALMDRITAAFESSVQWAQASLREDSVAWIAAGVGLALILWLFRGR